MQDQHPQIAVVQHAAKSSAPETMSGAFRAAPMAEIPAGEAALAAQKRPGTVVKLPVKLAVISMIGSHILSFSLLSTQFRYI
jgi:hypothetical protein